MQQEYAAQQYEMSKNLEPVQKPIFAMETSE